MIPKKNGHHVFGGNASALGNEPSDSAAMIGPMEKHVVDHVERLHLTFTAIDKLESDNFSQIGILHGAHALDIPLGTFAHIHSQFFN
jgi:hypothetical protein